MKIKESCSNCKFSFWGGVTRCRRHAPVLIDKRHDWHNFPSVDISGRLPFWCGDWKPKEDQTTPGHHLNDPGIKALEDKNMQLFIRSMGHDFLVTAVCKTQDDANRICAKDSNCGVIACDNQGLIYVANIQEELC